MAIEADNEVQDEGQEELRRRPPEEPEDEREESPEDDKPDVRVSEENGRTAVEMRPSRREQREARRRQEMEGHFKEFSKPLNDQLEQMRATMSQLATFMQQGRPQPATERRQEASEPDDYDRIVKEQEGIIRQMRMPGITEKQLDELSAKYHKLGRELLDTTADRRVKAALKDFKPQTGPDPHEAMLRAKYSDVFGNDTARDYAWALFLQMRAKAVGGGKPFDVAEAHEKALTEAAYEFNLRRRPAPAPSKAQQARFGGSPSGATERATGKPRHELSKAEKVAAREMFSRQKDWSDEKKFAEWAKRMGDEYWEERDKSE